MGIMQPTNRLRWNKTPLERVSTNLLRIGPPHEWIHKHARLEQLWTERPIGPGDGVVDPRSEWRPLQLVKLGWKEDEYDEPLEYDGT